MKRAGKGFLRFLSGKGRVHFSAKKCCVKCAKKAMPEGKAEKDANNFYQRKLL